MLRRKQQLSVCKILWETFEHSKHLCNAAVSSFGHSTSPLHSPVKSLTALCPILATNVCVVICSEETFKENFVSLLLTNGFILDGIFLANQPIISGNLTLLCISKYLCSSSRRHFRERENLENVFPPVASTIFHLKLGPPPSKARRRSIYKIWGSARLASICQPRWHLAIHHPFPPTRIIRLLRRSFSFFAWIFLHTYQNTRQWHLYP